MCNFCCITTNYNIGNVFKTQQKQQQQKIILSVQVFLKSRLHVQNFFEQLAQRSWLRVIWWSRVHNLGTNKRMFRATISNAAFLLKAIGKDKKANTLPMLSNIFEWKILKLKIICIEFYIFELFEVMNLFKIICFLTQTIFLGLYILV